MANYVERILRLKERDLGTVEYVGVPAYKILAHVSNGLRNRDQDERNSGDTWMSLQLTICNPDVDMITRGQRTKTNPTPK